MDVNRMLALCGRCNFALVGIVAVYFFFWPVFVLQEELRDPALESGGVPDFAYAWHQDLSVDFAVWARERVSSGAPTKLDINDISGTEWPMFSAVYYLWATEAIQAEWEQQGGIAELASPPNVYAREAIEAAAALITDQQNASWVIRHWGVDYLERENLFYRMLLIAGLSSYQKLTENNQYAELLVDQANKLAEELDASPYGLLDDYPGQCYPVDVLPAIAVINRAGEIISEDFQPFVKRSIRGFSGSRLDPETGLPAYIADRNSGVGYGPARGVGISYMLIWAPELWPTVADSWYARYEQHFWQHGWFIAGVREFSKNRSYPDWTIDVDAGPVINGLGTAASAFGIAAARANGRLDHAYPLSMQAVVSTWPLPNGTRLLPRLLSNLSDAPYLGETALLFVLTRGLAHQTTIVDATDQVPVYVYAFLLFYLLTGVGLVWGAYSRFGKTALGQGVYRPARTVRQVVVWCLAAIVAISSILLGEYLVTSIAFLLMLQLPRGSHLAHG
ncbi:MAG: hypothetical protein AAF431_08245 [Pseudomonadota bacterium]